MTGMLFVDLLKAKTFDEIIEIEKFNPYHDSKGRFATSGNYVSFTYAPGKSKAHDNAIQREKERTASRMPTEAQAKTLKGIERRTRNLKKEQFRVVDRDGNVIMQKQGDEHSVTFTMRDARENFSGNITVHNHPSGGTFSSDDLSAIGHGATEIRAAAPEGTYILRNSRYGGKYDAAKAKTWFDMRDDLDSASASFKTNRQLKSEIRKPFDKELQGYAEKWAKRKEEGAGQEELNKLANEYRAKADSYRPQIEVAARKAYVDQYHHWYKENAGKYGLEYEFVPVKSRVKKSGAEMDEIPESVLKGEDEIVLDRKMQEDIEEITDAIIEEIKAELPEVEKSEIEKFNPYHDAKGRFSGADGAVPFTYKPGASTAHDKAIQRAKIVKSAAKSFGEVLKVYYSSDLDGFDVDDEIDRVVKTWTDTDGIYTEEIEKKGNPYHDPKTGRFTTGPGASNPMIRTEPPPKNTKIAYKVFVARDGKLYPPMVANPDGQDTPVGVWLNASEGKKAMNKDGTPVTNTLGRERVVAGGKGTQGGSGQLAYRPGWHLGEVPEAKQFYTKDKQTGEKKQKKNFVWAECEIAADFDYQEEAMSYGYNKNGKFQHSLAGLPKIPKDGYYTYRTNPDPTTKPWYITGAMKVNRILTDAETNKILRDHGIEPMKRDGGELDLAALGFKETNFVKKSEQVFSVYKADDDKRLVFGWASISMTVDGEQLQDLQKDMIDPEDLEEAVYDYVLKFRDTGEEHNPSKRKKGKLVESCVLTKEKQQAMGIPEGILPVGWWIGFKIEDDEAWDQVKNGTYKMFSIEGKANRVPVEKSNKQEEAVDKSNFDYIVEKNSAAKNYDVIVEIEKFNPYHDAKGRFASANGAASFTYAPGKSNAHDLAIARAAAYDKVAKAKEAEPKLTNMMKDCAVAAGGEMVGLEYAVKGEGSLTRKIKSEMVKNGSDVKAALDDMKDVNRYTMQLNEDNFVSGYEKTVSTLKSNGYEVARVKNSLGDPTAPYRGVNTNIKSPDGSIWELQFHTAKSLEVKEVNHKLYETQRKDNTPVAKQVELGKQMAQNAASIPSPKGIEKILPFDNL